MPATIEAKVVVGDDDVGAFPGDVRSLAPHRHPDMGVLQRGCVVDAVAGDGDEMAVASQRQHDRKLLGGIDAGIDARLAGERVERRRAARFRLADGIAGDDLIVGEGEARRGRDRPRGSADRLR